MVGGQGATAAYYDWLSQQEETPVYYTYFDTYYDGADTYVPIAEPSLESYYYSAISYEPVPEEITRSL